MAPKTSLDKFANIAYLAVVETAANTLTFAQLQIASNLMDKKYALVIERIHYLVQPLATVFDTTGDYLNIAVTVSDRLSSISDLSQPEILDLVQLQRRDYGAAASGSIEDSVIQRDFTSLSGGGILVPADRLYLGAKGSGLASATTVLARMWYSVLEIGVNEYWELIEARRIMTT